MPGIADILPDGSPGWSAFVQTGAYDGVTFDFVSTADELGRVVDRQQIPNRDGVQLVDRAREGRIFDVLAIFVEDDYPDVMNRLIAKINAGGVHEFVHPIFGAFKALVTHASIRHDAEDSIDSATMQLHVEEHTEGTVGPQATTTSIAARANKARTSALAVLNAASVYLAAADALPNLSATIASAIAANVDGATSAANLASATADSLEAASDTLSAIEIQAQANTSLAAADAAQANVESCTTNATPMPEQYDLVQALIEMAQAIAALAAAIAAGKPALTTFTVDADIPLLAWVHAKYGDSSRVDEVLVLNSFVDPLVIPAGTEIIAYAT